MLYAKSCSDHPSWTSESSQRCKLCPISPTRDPLSFQFTCSSRFSKRTRQEKLKSRRGKSVDLSLVSVGSSAAIRLEKALLKFGKVVGRAGLRNQKKQFPVRTQQFFSTPFKDHEAMQQSHAAETFWPYRESSASKSSCNPKTIRNRSPTLGSNWNRHMHSLELLRRDRQCTAGPFSYIRLSAHMQVSNPLAASPLVLNSLLQFRTHSSCSHYPIENAGPALCDQ